MKRLLMLSVFLISSLAAQAQAQTATLINLLANLVKCPTTFPAFIMWTGTTISCVALGPGFALSGGILSVAPAPSTPAWQVETVSLALLAAGSTSISYTTAKAPVAGAVLYWYSSTNVFLSASGAVAVPGRLLAFDLPPGWLPTDTIIIAYQSQ